MAAFCLMASLCPPTMHMVCRNGTPTDRRSPGLPRPGLFCVCSSAIPRTSIWRIAPCDHYNTPSDTCGSGGEEWRSIAMQRVLEMVRLAGGAAISRPDPRFLDDGQDHSWQQLESKSQLGPIANRFGKVRDISRYGLLRHPGHNRDTYRPC